MLSEIDNLKNLEFEQFIDFISVDLVNLASTKDNLLHELIEYSKDCQIDDLIFKAISNIRDEKILKILKNEQ